MSFVHKFQEPLNKTNVNDIHVNQISLYQSMGNLQLNSDMIQQNLAEEQIKLWDLERNTLQQGVFVPRASLAAKGSLNGRLVMVTRSETTRRPTIKIFLPINPESEAYIFIKLKSLFLKTNRAYFGIYL